MKHLKDINELYKGTYQRAAVRLKQEHPHRYKKLSDWAKEKGDPNNNIDRIHPYRFVFENYKQFSDMSNRDNFLGYFSITNIKKDGVKMVVVSMSSSYGEEISISIDNGNYMKIYWADGFHERWFLFENRKDALEFRKFIVDQDDVELNFTININRIYTTKYDES